MSIFDKIKHAIFGDHGPLGQFNQEAAQQASGGQAPAAPAQPAVPAATPQTPAAPAAATVPVDVGAILQQKADAAGRPSNWRTSIVDLLTLLGLDSSLAARKELAQELNVHAGADGSAEQNIALHKAVMKRLAENGGKVPADMLG